MSTQANRPDRFPQADRHSPPAAPRPVERDLGGASLQTILDAGHVGAWTFDVETRTLTTSRSCRTTFGRDPDLPFPYRALLHAIDGRDRARVVALARTSVATGREYDVEFRVGTSGGLRWIGVRGQITNAGGTAKVISGLAVDMTDRREGKARAGAQAALTERLRELDDPDDIAYAAAELLGTTFNVSRAGYGTVDPVAETITIERDWNAPGIRTIAGVLHFRDYGSYIEDLKDGRTVAIGDADADARTTATAAVLKSISAQSFVNMPVTEYGGLVGLLYLNHAEARDWSDEELAFIREVADRTRSAVARRLAEQQLRELAASLERQVAARTHERDRIWNKSQDLLLVQDHDGVFREVNPAWTRVLGWARGELTGRQHTDLVHPDDQAATDIALTTARQGDLPVFENRLRHKDGSYRWIAWVASPDGDSIYSSGRNVTAEKAKSIELEAAQDQLRQSQKMEAVGQLTGGLAHDFNNLLTGIVGSLELIDIRVAQGRAGEIGRYVLAAQGAAKRAAALTHRLLAFSRRQTLDPKPVDVNRLVADMEELIRRTVGPAIEVEVVGSTGLWAALVDGNQLENALLNLCINARDAMPSGGRLTIETANRWLDDRQARERDMAPGQYLALSVTDTGTGMSADVVSRAFDPFFTTKPLGEGTGLGLSMVYGFARQSGGQVRIYSEPGAGTTMRVYLPRHHATEGEVVVEEDLPAEPTRVEASRTILIVDDEPTIRMLVIDVAGEAGFTTLEAADGAAAIRILESDVRIDLLITDIGLPAGVNGRQVADAARRLRPELTVLFITGYAENAVIGNGPLDPGMSVITKPFSVALLTRRIAELTGAPSDGPADHPGGAPAGARADRPLS